MFGKRALPPGFEYFPVGYHGRTSTIVPSGTQIVRPKGQFRDEEGKVAFGPTKRLDYELEVAAVIGKSSVLGEPIKIRDADDYIFGCVLLNDWSGESDLADPSKKPRTKHAEVLQPVIYKASKCHPWGRFMASPSPPLFLHGSSLSTHCNPSRFQELQGTLISFFLRIFKIQIHCQPLRSS